MVNPDVTRVPDIDGVLAVALPGFGNLKVPDDDVLGGGDMEADALELGAERADDGLVGLDLDALVALDRALDVDNALGV